MRWLFDADDGGDRGWSAESCCAFVMCGRMMIQVGPWTVSCDAMDIASVACMYSSVSLHTTTHRTDGARRQD